MPVLLRAMAVWRVVAIAIAGNSEAARFSTWGGSFSEGRRQELLWLQFFLEPFLWLDNRQCKKNFRSPDFRHRESQDVLWLDSPYKPAWVDTQLAALDIENGRSMQDGLDPLRSAGYGKVVSKPCEEGQLLTEAVEALEILVHTDCPISKSLLYTLIKKCVACKDLLLGRRVHALTVKKGYKSDTFLCNHILRMYVFHGRLPEAVSVFSMVDKPDAFMWSSIISAHVRQGQDKQAISLYHQMRRSSVKPDGHVFVACLQACARGADLKTGQQVHADVLASGVEPHLFVWNCLVDMYAKCGSLEDAQRVFGGLGEKDVVTWNAMITGYSQQGMGHEALGLYLVLQEEGKVSPDAVTFVCVLQACANVAALHIGRQLHAQIKEQGLQLDVLVAISLINMYAKSGNMGDAQEVFDALPKKDVVTWSALIAGYTRQGHSEKVFDLVQRMRGDGIQPDSITFLSILTVCSHTGLLDRGREYFEAMRGDYGIMPTVDHYTCMVDLLGRAGCLDESLDLVRKMPLVPNVSVWHTVLSACQKWGNVEVGRHAFEEAVKLDKKDAAAYVLMSNIYTGAQMWEHAQEMQDRRTGIGAWKQPGQSWWTDMDGLVHKFSVRCRISESEASLKRFSSTV